MKVLLQILIVAVLALLMEMWLPWWSVAIAGGLGGLLLGGSGMRGFAAGFLGVGILWAVAALRLSAGTESGLAERLGAMLPGQPGGVALAVVSGVIGGLVAGFAGASGARLRGSVWRSSQ